MKLKISLADRQLHRQALKRFKYMGSILVALVGSMLLKEYVTEDVLDSMYLIDVVDAADEEYDFVPKRFLVED